MEFFKAVGEEDRTVRLHNGTIIEEIGDKKEDRLQDLESAGRKIVVHFHEKS